MGYIGVRSLVLMIALIVAAATEVRAAVQTVTGWTISRSNGSIQVRLTGTWHNGCGPGPPQVSVSGQEITILVPPPDLPPLTTCSQAIGPWTQTVPLGTLPDGFYTIRVLTYGAPEPSTAPAVLAAFSMVVVNGIASLPREAPTMGWPALLLCWGAMLAFAGTRRR